jgi:invasion protein IalB
LAATLAVLVLAAPALAQQQPKAPAQKQAPAAQPAQSEAPAQPGQQQQAANHQQPQLTSFPWMKVCSKGPDTNNRQVCVITKARRLEDSIAIIQLFEPEGGQKFLRVTVPLGMKLSYGTRMLIDQNQPSQSPYNMCFSGGCASHYQGYRRPDC